MYLNSLILSGAAGSSRHLSHWNTLLFPNGSGGSDQKQKLKTDGSAGEDDQSANPMAKRTANDACANVEVHVDRVLSKFSSYNETFDSSLNNIIDHILTLQKELLTGAEPGSELSVAAVLIWEQALKKLRDLLERMGAEHREMHGGVSKCGREIDKHFERNLMDLCPKEAQQYENDPNHRHNVNKLIAQHLMSHGQLDVADCLEEEAGINIEPSNKATFVEMQTILDSLKDHQLDIALNWVKENRASLLQQNSMLEFTLHKLKFIELLKAGVDGQMAAVEYARNFQPFADKHAPEIQTLMGSLLFLPAGLEKSPYSNLLDPILWAEIGDMFTKDSRCLLGLSVNSPLSVLLNAGTKAIPALLNLRQVMQQRQVMSIWGHNEELPIEIDLGPENRFHSIFSCPILRQQTSDNNPPMRLNCGHVISKDALHRLAANNKLKCPYCPVESVLNDARQIYF